MNIRTLAVRILNSCRNRYSGFEDKVSATADRLKLSGPDRDFLYMMVKGVIVYQRYLDYAIEKASQRSVKKFESAVLNLLRVGALQALILETPLYALTNETVEAARQLKKKHAVGLINAVLRHLPDRAELKAALSHLPEKEALAIETSHPQWLIERWTRNFGAENCRQLAEFNNHYQKIYFRHNPFKVSWPNLQDILKKEGFEIAVASAGPIPFFTVDNPGDLLRSDLFSGGLFSVQDISQAQAVLLLNPQKDETVIDACAAPGGKTTLIAQMAGGKASITTYDVSPGKVELIKNEAFRLGIDFVNYGVADARTGNYAMADRILLDVPCTGTGVIARRADLRWNRTIRQLDTLIKMQRDILTNMSNFVKDGGVLVYSTCSVEPEENWENVEWFLKSNRNFSVEDARDFVPEKWCDNRGAIYILPHLQNETGGFAVRMRKQ
ncbi:MAG: 16S rRNA (cytosine(967)-C(5))-methyltransferase RsmB [Candidatus Marinimicrobia bacterium]|nr:16S rRNA (cytosine(967)-C(5))-methyltransferase RsmB [Candidatus Neomarinimicrobiota bacterium]